MCVLGLQLLPLTWHECPMRSRGPSTVIDMLSAQAELADIPSQHIYTYHHLAPLALSYIWCDVPFCMSAFEAYAVITR